MAKEDLKIWAEAALKIIRVYWNDEEADMCPVCGIRPKKLIEKLEVKEEKPNPPQDE